MSLTLVSVPIGDLEDITLRALKTLRESSLIIGEERKPLFRLFADLKLPRPKAFELLNEHSNGEDYRRLVDLCEAKKVALVTDCGTPGFCDPGARLVELCRKKGIAVTSNPGACSLAVFLSLCGRRLDQFYFQGFLPRGKDERRQRLRELDRHHRPYILMDTPYRLERTVSDCCEVNKTRKMILGTNLTQSDEALYEGPVDQVLKKIKGTKKEFMALIL